MIADKLIQAIDEKKNPSVIGLDPRYEKLPQFLKNTEKAKAVFEFNKLIIDSIKDIVPAVKPQSAFYEVMGINGIKALFQTIEYAKKQGLLVILDAKKNDIGSTAEAYAKAYLSKGTGIDFLTITPYLGKDSIQPFIEVSAKNNKGIFVLVKTSNPGSADFQEIKADDKFAYEYVADMLDNAARQHTGKTGYSGIGAVVGATYPNEASKIRNMLLKSIFLVPGYGKQGGTADDAIECFDKKGYGAIVNSSRGVTFSFRDNPSKQEFCADIKTAALNMKADLHAALKRADKFPW
ncbi:MAG: orotidine-5'-phosphate decarboxylase [Nanobdellota archaeon]